MKSLFSRLLLSASVIVFILILISWQWLQFSQEYSRNEVQQSLHRELAAHMAHINPLLSQGITSDEALKEAFHDFMLLGPSFEIYTLDLQGNIIAFDAVENKIKRTQVSLAPITSFITGSTLPIKGEDPRSLDSDKIFSAAKLNDQSGKETGYLYVIIGGEDFDTWQSLVSEHHTLKIWGGILLSSIIFALMLFALLAKYFTSPLSRLEHDLRLVETQKLDDGLSLSHEYKGSIEIRQLSQHIKRLLNEISEQHQSINRQQQARHDFLLHLSHDLKTPLTSLQGYIDTWLLLPPNERSSDLIKIAANSGQYIQQLLSQMLELAALENGQITPEFKDTDLNSLLQELKLYFAPRAKTQKVELKFELIEQITVNTDPQLLMRVLSNLVDNAIRYTPSGGAISISLRHSAEEVRQQNPEHIWLSVSDNGSGMHKHELQALQQMQTKPNFKRIDSLPQLGVGLAIVRHLLGLLECKIDIESTPGVGSCFQIELKVR
ncbi:HAMP domain-containing sensor histidine kinase [Shewanella sp. UCD-KL12]|uniref:sensor histidine kinase n=1 Tax=Shewanella sp. UCD-KL12 TaxID=1917163 RepID=UPI0009706A34|nr:HAMP domain-containing sensor histidine kinase [Shewanella sp. UCD-KL12]